MSAEDRYRALLLHAPDPILTVDRDARVIAANLVACTVLGATESALMRTQILSRVPEAEQREAAKLLMRGFNGRSAEERIGMVCDKGVYRRFLMRVVPIPQRGGTPIVTLLLRDVTDADRIAEQGRRAAHLERTPGQFMLTLDLTARIQHAVGLDATLGHPDQAWEGVDARELLEYGPHRDEIFANVETDLSEVGSWASVQRCVRADGSRVTVRLFATPRLDPDTKEAIGCYMSGLVIVPRSATPAGAPVVSAERVLVREARRVSAGALPVVAPDAPPSVLVVDDDASMRSIVRRFLERAGYTVIEGMSGRNALGLLRDGAAVHFVVTDLKMPDGSGGWFMAQLGYEFPKLLPRTIVISGDAEGAGAAHVSARWRCPVLAKPFTASQLVNTLVRLASGVEEVA